MKPNKADIDVEQRFEGQINNSTQPDFEGIKLGRVTVAG